MKSFKQIGIHPQRSIHPLAGGNRVADRAAVSGAGHAPSQRPSEYLPGRSAWSNLFLFSFLCAVLALAGCSAARPRLGAISVSDPTSGAAITSVIVNATANASLPVNGDGPNLGVDWSLNCGGSPNTALEPASVACGSLNPVHVGSSIAMLYTAPAYVPVGNTVTLTASATSAPSVSASVTLTIAPRPVTIAWTQGELPPATGCPSGIPYCMAASGAGFFDSAQLAATVSNDPTAVGVNWSCAPALACGSFNPTLTASGGSTTLYTAPAPALSTIPAGGLPVTVSATPACETESLNPCNSSASISATITIMPVAVAVAVLPSTVEAGGGRATLTATVTWDASSGGVTWAAACSAGGAACGSITPGACGAPVAPTFASACAATYTAPQSLPAGAATLPVTVTAQSNVDSTKSGSGAITVGPPPPVSVSVAGPSGSSQMESQVNGTTILTATVANDFSNGGVSAGVNWNCTPGSCSPASSTSLPFTTTYTAPGAIPAANPVTVTAVSIFCSQNPNATQCAGDAAATGSASITILSAISVAITPPASITAGVGATFSATVTNDVNNAGVDWTASCTVSSNCGSFTPAHTVSGASTTFLAPYNLPWSLNPIVTITATSTASKTAPPLFPSPFLQPGAGVQDPVSVAVTPVTYVHFVPFAPSQLPLGGNAVSLIAVAANDTTNAGVDWSACSDATTCGQFLVSPAVPQTLTSPAVSAVYSPKLHAASGQAVSYLPPNPSQAPSGGLTVTITAASTAAPSASASQAIAITNSGNFTGVALTGKVLAGTMPVSGTTVQLYQAGNTGYGSAAAPLTFSNGANSVTTASDGSFTIPAGYTCTFLTSSGSSQFGLLYLVATGGTPSGRKSPNGQLGLMTALGPCGNLNSSVSLVVNAVTTVATAWALAPFTGTGGGSFQNYEYIGSSSSNYNGGPILISGENYANGLANAFATVNNLVDITAGQALYTTPAGGGYTPPGGSTEVYDGVVPQAEINTLADAIDTCAATTGGVPGDGSACDAFFQASDVNPVGGIGTSSNSPSTILQAVLEVARYPSKMGINIGNVADAITGTPLYSLVANEVASGQTPPFPTILSAPPTDWSIALSFSGGGLEGARRAGPTAMAVDATGNLWIANRSISSVTELSNLGIALSPYATGATLAAAGGFKGDGLSLPRQIAVDPYGNAWVLNGDSSMSEGMASCLSATSLNPFCGSGSFPYEGGSGNTAVGLAIDGTGNLWVADNDNFGAGGDVAEYAGFYSCKDGSACAAGGTQVASGGLIGDYTNLTDGTDIAALASPQTIAIDGKQDVWVLDNGNYTAVVLSGKNGSLELVDHGNQSPPNSGLPPSYVLSSQQWGGTMAINSGGNIFIPSFDPTDYNDIYELYNCEAGANSGNCGFAPQPIGLSSVSSAGLATPIAIDGSNGLWLVSNANPGYSMPASVVELSVSGTFLNANVPLNPGFGYVASTFAASTMAAGSTVTYAAATPWKPMPTSISGDASGNLWVLSSSAETASTGQTGQAAFGPVWEFVGVATPVVTPLSLGKPGTKP